LRGFLGPPGLWGKPEPGGAAFLLAGHNLLGPAQEIFRTAEKLDPLDPPPKQLADAGFII